jgi:hypothetical protein
MHPLFAHLRTIDSIDERCALLGDALGLGERVAPGVLERAWRDDTYAFHLVMSRHNRHTLDRLLGMAERPDSGERKLSPPSTAGLVRKAGGALARWAASGFARVSDEECERRFRACEACDHLRQPPAAFVYQVALVRASDRRICAACGCSAVRKARLATEHCPLPDPSDSSLNRWGERRQSTGPE